MKVFLVLWHPSWPMGPMPGTTSSGIRKSGIALGDEIVVLKGNPGRGMVGHGKASSRIYRAPHHTDPDKEANWVDVEWTTWVNNDQTLPVLTMAEVATDLNWYAVQGGGIQLSASDGEALMQAWTAHIAQLDSPKLNPSSGVRPTVRSDPAEQGQETRRDVVGDDSLVRIDFVTPVEGSDIRDQATFCSDRHYLYASSIHQDRSESLFVGSGGEIVGRWPTDLIDHIQWIEAKKPNEVESPTTDDPLTHQRTDRPLIEDEECQLQSEVDDERTSGWTEHQDHQLRIEFNDGATMLELVQTHERSQASLIAALKRLELIPYYAFYSDLGPDGDMTDWRASDDPAKPPRKSKRWTEDEDRQLQSEFNNGRTMLELVQAHERSPGAVMANLRRLKLVPFDAMYSDIGSGRQATGHTGPVAEEDLHETEPAAPDSDHVSRAGESWSAEEDTQLLQAHEAGQPIKEIAERHQRTTGEIQRRLRKLGFDIDGSLSRSQTSAIPDQESPSSEDENTDLGRPEPPDSELPPPLPTRASVHQTPPGDEEECRHGLRRTECVVCKWDGYPAVFISDGGQAFHSRNDCSALRMGQDAVDRRGGLASPIQAVNRGSQRLIGRDPCEVCKPE